MSASVLLEKHGDKPAQIVFPCRLSSQQLILNYPRGAYTTARTVGRNAVMDFRGHMERLAKSLSMIAFTSEGSDIENAAVSQSLADARTTSGVTALIHPLIRSAMQRFASESPQNNSANPGSDISDGSNPNAGELKVVMLITYSFEEHCMATVIQVADLADAPQSPCCIQITGFPRKAAEAKDSQWVRDRQSLEKTMLPGTQEIVLRDDSGALFEGLTSNFFVVKDNAIWTAAPGTVLHGTIQKLVEEVCKRNQIPLHYEFPNINSIESWQGAFITSTSRLVLPVGTVKLEDQLDKPISLPQADLTKRIGDLVKEELLKQAEHILP